MEYCSIKEVKIQALKKYNRAHQFLYNLVLYSLTSLITFLFFSYPLWFPCMKQFLFSLPNNISLFFNAKCLFILGNIIVFILVGESKLTRSSSSSPASEIYDEYIARSKKNIINVKEGPSKQSLNTIEEKKHGIKNKEINLYRKEKKKEMRVSKSKSMHHNHIEEKKKGLRACKSEVWGESRIVEMKKTMGEKDDKLNYVVPNEDFNKRVEAFIARVNKQRLLEGSYLN